MVDLDPSLRLLFALKVAVQQRDPVLVSQVAARAEQSLSPREMRRTFSRLSCLGATEEDLAWLRTSLD